MTSRKVAFIGRSNVGKSTLINALLGKGTVAKVSKRPGKTRRIGEYDFSTKMKLVDMPGYGFARAKGATRENWDGNLLKLFFEDDLLVNIFILIDASIKPMKIDQEFIEWCRQNNLPFSIVFTKIDKGTQKEISTIQKLWSEWFKDQGTEIENIQVSSEKKKNLHLLKEKINSL